MPPFLFRLPVGQHFSAMNPTANPNSNNAAPAILEQLRLRAGGSEMYPHCSLKILNDSRENFPAWFDAVRAA